MSLQYWIEATEAAIEEAGMTATPEQIKSIAETMEGSHENYGMAFYQPENPLIGELQEAKQKLEEEKAKVFCAHCNGKGRIYSQGPHHGSDSQCWKCHGEGKHK